MEDTFVRIRLNKILADAGVASRRGAERLLAEGRVAVNGQVMTEPGAQADPAHDTVTVNGRTIGRTPSGYLYIMLNKPPGVMTTASDPQGRPTVLDLVDRPERLFTVGRLDRDTEGLLLLTNDGDWANRVAHPGGGVEKEYEVTVDGIPDEAALRQLAEGVALPDGHVAHGEARVLDAVDGKARVLLLLREGHKRQARLMFGAIGRPVRRLVRVREGGLRLGGLALGTWRELSLAEVDAVLRPPAARPLPRVAVRPLRAGMRRTGVTGVTGAGRTPERGPRVGEPTEEGGVGAAGRAGARPGPDGPGADAR